MCRISLSGSAGDLAPRPNDPVSAIAAAQSQLAALTTRIAAVEAERDVIVAALERARRALDLVEASASDAPPISRAPLTLDVGSYRLTLGEQHGTRVDRADIRRVVAPARRRDRTPNPDAFPAVDIRRTERAQIWALLAAGARVVRVAGDPGAGSTRLLKRLAADAGEHGFADGALYLTEVRGPALDIGQRLAHEFYADAAPRYEFAAELGRLFRDVAALILLDRAEINADEQAELSDVFPSLRFIIVDPLAIAATPACGLGPLDPDETLAMLEAGYGRPIEPGRAAALAIGGAAGALPGPTRLAGVAAGNLAQSFSEPGPTPTAAELIGALIARLTPAEQRALATVALAPAVLTTERLAQIEDCDNHKPQLERLIDYGLLATDAGVYSVPAYVAPLVPHLPDAATVFERIVEVARSGLDPAAPAALTDAQLATVERTLQTAFERSHWKLVVALGPPLAELLAARAALGAWGRVLNLIAAAAKRASDRSVLNATRHELGVRSLVLRDHRHAATQLDLAARERASTGDAAGAAASRAILALVEPDVPAAPERARPQPRRVPRRRQTSRRTLLAGLAIGIAVMLGIWFWTRPAAGPVIAEFSSDRQWIPAGAVAHVCAHATGADLVEVAPDIGPVAAAGRSCFAVRPTHTTTYSIVASGADGQEIHRAMTLEVRAGGAARPVHIEAFAARPARIGLGQSAHLCFAVTGAERLRIVPDIGSLTRLAACRTLRPDAPRRYTFHLIAIGENGQVAIRRTQLEVMAAASASAAPVSAAAAAPVAVPPAPARASSPQPAAATTAPPPRLARRGGAATRSEPDGRLARRAIYQFDATPGVVERGQAASICVGIGTWARGEVNGIGTLPPGITKCYRVHPFTTTVYRLHVALDRSIAVERLTVAVRLPSRVHQVAHGGAR